MREVNAHSDGISGWLRLTRAQGVGPTLSQRLVEAFGSPDQVLGATAGQLCEVDGVGPGTAQRILYASEQVDIDRELKLADRLGVWFVHRNDPRYPVMLSQIYDPPPVLSVKGALLTQHNLSLAVVGSRRCSAYGQDQASRLSHLLALSGFTIVSGMARGIDTAAHRGALSSQGQTIAVQGCGLARCYPLENKDLCRRITRQGCVLSELPLQAEPLKAHFPARNRIIAGLSMATIVVEAGLRSGAMITARLAMEHDREVMAVPGQIDNPLTQGPHHLLKQGALLVDSADTVVAALGVIGQQLRGHVNATVKAHELQEQALETRVAMTHTEQSIYDQLSHAPTHADDIIVQTHLPTGKVTADLVNLQLKGLVQALPGNLFIKKGSSFT
ncbi:MAG: DNA-protecting protein DprA [Planctomycetes bacterium]|nr:DNA-protecting protein DprA [Planctomycetota bacterium]